MGGAERVFLSLLERLDRAKFDVFAAYHGTGHLSAEFQRYAPTVGPFNLLRFWDPRTIATLARHMRRIGCHVVHSHLWTADVLVGCAAVLARVPVRVATVHGSYFHLGDATWEQRIRRVPLSRLYRFTYAAFDRVIAVSDAVRRDLTSRPGVRVPGGKIEVIPNGLDVARMGEVAGLSADSSLRRKAGIPLHAPVISTVANFVPIKGHQWLIRAIPIVRMRVPDAVFVLHGSGESKTAVRDLVDLCGLGDHVVFSDSRAVDARDVLAASDVVVVPSLSEGFGMVILEACALGKPVVTTAVGGIPEILEHHRTGILVPPKDPEALAVAILSVLLDPALAQRLGEAGRRHVRAAFPVERMLRDIEALYLRVAASKRCI